MTNPSQTVPSRTPKAKAHANENCFLIDLPAPRHALDQHEEWCVVKRDGAWREVRFHDYGAIYEVPGLYEHIFYEVLKCNSPATIVGLLQRCLSEGDEPLRAFDLGAGNGMVGEQLARIGAETIVGVDILEEAAHALKRDRPGLYNDFLVADMTRLTPEQKQHLRSYRFNCLTCVAALGFGDIPPEVFKQAYNLIEPDGWIAFNIKADFVEKYEGIGFAGLIRDMVARGDMELRVQEKYTHRLSTSGEPLNYIAYVGSKRRDLED